MAKKLKSRDWLATSRARRIVQLTNIKDKVPAYEPILPLSRIKVSRIVLCCETYLAMATYVEQTRATTEQLTDYDGLICQATGGTRGAPAPTFVGFKELTLPPEAFQGVIVELRELVDDIKHTDNYTRAIGEDLMIVPIEGEERDPNSIVAAIKPQVITGTYRIRIEGSLQGMSAMRFEWRRKGSNAWQIVGFLTKLPAEITIPAAVAGEPESGELRAVLVDKNEDVGQPSPNYSLTVG